jgi:hypothetical protein
MPLERFPSFRASQMRLEAATSRRRDTTVNLRQVKLVTVKTIVNVVYRTETRTCRTRRSEVRSKS